MDANPPEIAADPHLLFDAWLAEAQATEPNDPSAMALATADARGRPSVRMVLLKGHDPRGFVFYTNLDSRKGGDLYEENIAYMDKLVGKLVDELEALKLREKTLIIFVGDNGTASDTSDDHILQ